jgi:hypothetical protein
MTFHHWMMTPLIGFIQRTTGDFQTESALSVDLSDIRARILATTHTYTMFLARALDLLKEKCPDYHKVWAETVTSLNLDPASMELASYLEMINNDPVEWFNSFPDAAVSVPALAKGKSALTYLVKCPEVRALVGGEVCDAIAANVCATWKQHKEAISEKREKQRAEQQRQQRSAVLDEEEAQPPPPESPSSQSDDGGHETTENEFDVLLKQLYRTRDELDDTRAKLNRIKSLFAASMKIKGLTELENVLLAAVLQSC